MNLILPIFSLFILVLLQVVFYIKPRLNNVETNIYKYLLLISTLNISFNILGIYNGYTTRNMLFLNIINHLDLPLYFWWASLLFLYLYNIYTKKNYKIIKTIVLWLNSIFTFLTIILPFEVVVNDFEGYAKGTCVNFVYIICAVYICLCVFFAFKILKTGKFKKTLPVFVLLICGIFAILVQKIMPNLIVIPGIIVFIELIMFFTIENPDLKILNEYSKNKELLEQIIEEKNNLLFKLSENIVIPLQKIKEENINLLKKEDIKSIYKVINENNLRLNDVINLINEVYNISNINRSFVEIKENKYNVYNLLSQIILIVKNKYSDNCIFKYSVSESLPECLYGDDLHLKQTIISLINFLNNGKQCIIDFDVSTITRYNICRLIITIHCSGYTISLQDINKILESSDNITKNEIENINLEDYKVDLKVIKQIINFLGGTLLIKSDKEFGTEFKIIINQMIYEDTKNNKLLSYEYTNKKRILIVDSNLKELNSLTKQMRNYNFIVTSTLYPNELISKLKSKEKYDLVFINDDLNGSSAVKVIKQLKNVNLKDTKIIVMLNENKEHIKNHYLTEYKFYDYLLKNDYENEMNRILTKLKW